MYVLAEKMSVEYCTRSNNPTAHKNGKWRVAYGNQYKSVLETKYRTILVGRHHEDVENKMMRREIYQQISLFLVKYIQI